MAALLYGSGLRLPECGHLLSLCMLLVKGHPFRHARGAFGWAVQRKDRFVWLTPPDSLGERTVAKVVGATTTVEHSRAVRMWAERAWPAWASHHDTLRGWAARF